MTESGRACDICPARCRVGEGLLPESSVGVKEARRTKTTQVNARMATADHDRQGQAAHRQTVPTNHAR